MKASLRWLREFVDLPEEPEEVGRIFDLLGVEVEGMERLPLEFAAVSVARVVGIEPHPNADRLRVVTIDTGDGERAVVCGAWNFETGATVAYAPPGSRLSGGLDVEERAIRGVTSPGMICSEAELGIGDDAEGILVLDPGEAAVGEALEAAVPLPDTVFDLKITPNRPDLMSIHGLARDLAAFLDRPLQGPQVPQVQVSGTSRVRVRIEDPERCPRFTAREISGVTVGPSPLWLRTRLRAVGVRPVSNVVDVTNFVMMELGQPLHAFDLDLVGEETVVVRTAERDERLVTLDGVERLLRPTDLVIADAQRPMGLAGIMGGEATEVSQATTRVLLEVAHFEPGGILLSGKHHGLRSEAVARFERGVDPELPPLASARAAGLILDLCGGRAVGDLVDDHPRPAEPRRITFRTEEVERLLGVALERTKVATMLARLGFGTEGDDPMTVQVPTHRPDVAGAADLVEEVARLHGLDAIPSRLRTGSGGGLPESERVRRRAREVMQGSGYYEIISFDFVAESDIQRMGFPEGDRRSSPLRVRNPLSEEQAHLRTSLLPGLLAGLRTNLQRQRADAALFELGAVYLPSDGPLPDQPHLLGFAAMGRVPGLPWGEATSRDALDATGLVETLFGSFGVGYELVPSAEPGMHPGRSARVLVDGAPVGTIGEVHPQVAAGWNLEGRVVAGEIDTACFALGSPRRFRVPSPFPPVVFDLAFDLGAEVPAARLLEVVETAAGERLEHADVFDVFVGAPIGAGRKSVALRLTFRDAERTLTDDELGPVREGIAAAVATELDGRLRGG